MNNTLENKAKFFGQYTMQFILKRINDLEMTFRVIINFADLEPNCNYLELKPLSAITDEEAIILVDLFSQEKYTSGIKSKINYGKHFADSLHYTNGSWMVSLGKTSNCIDYLRSNGYALPWMGISVDQMQDWGWIK